MRCYDPLTLVAIAGTAYAGYSSMQASNREAKLQKEQANIAAQEAQSNAEVEAYNQRQALNKQKLAFIKSGVSLEGSPLDVLENTRSWGQKSVDAILKSGASQYNLGMQRAANTQASGRAAMIGGVLGSAGTAAKYQMKKNAEE